MTFTLRCPSSENPHLRNEAQVLSRHRTLGAARRALLEYQHAVERQGYGCEAYIWDDEKGCLVSPDNTKEYQH